MDLGLTNRVALVCGASRGLGLAVAVSLAREGASLVIAARDERALDEAAAHVVRETEADVKPVPTDLSRPEEIRALAEAAFRAFGRVEILVNNAGGPPPGEFLDFKDRDWEAAFRLNLMSAVMLTREVVPDMKTRRWGRVLNLTSIAVKQPIDGLMLSNSIRAGVHGWAKSLAVELAPWNITVNNVMPGYTLTDRVGGLAKALAQKEGLEPSDIIARWEAAVPMKRLGRPQDLGDLVAYLASEQAGYITGASIPIDGGYDRGLL
ncbi:MAG: SDR family oxidoreductase [Proteobacteria bacterium]|nr:SDR family oxidoreductase [Pseudomonadota bacterium]